MKSLSHLPAPVKHRVEDIPAWCAKHGQEFIGVGEDEEADCYRLYIKKLH